MDENGDCLVETAIGTHKHCYYQFMKKTLHFLLPVSIFSFMFSYFSGFPFLSYYLQFSTLIFSLSAQALDRKFMFIICNAILAFLANNLKFSSSSFNTRSAEDIVKQTTLEVEENVTSMKYTNSPLNVTVAEEKQQHEQGYGDSEEADEDMKAAGFISEVEDWEEDDEQEVVEESRGLENTSEMEEVNDARVSTEELNKKFEEFIRKMKEEIRIESQQPLITVE